MTELQKSKLFKRILSIIEKRFSNKEQSESFENCKVAVDFYFDLYKNEPNTHFLHALRSAELACTSKFDHRVVISALFHHITDRKIIPKEFEQEIRLLVKCDALKINFEKLQAAEQAKIDCELENPINFFKLNTVELINKVSSDLRPILVLLCSYLDRVENFEQYSLGHGPKEEIAKRIFFYFIPLTHFLGITDLTRRIEKHALRLIIPEFVETFPKIESNEFIEQIVSPVDLKIKSFLTKFKKANINHYSWRTKGIFSTFVKLHKNERSNSDFKYTNDVVGFRIVMSSEQECKELCNMIMAHWPITEGSYNDYYSNPKDNNYKAYHLGIYQKGIPIEIQIKDWDNHVISQEGDLAHPIYKLKNPRFPIAENEFLCKLWQHWFNLWVINFLSKFIVAKTSEGQFVVLEKKSTLMDMIARLGLLKKNVEYKGYRNSAPVDPTKNLITGDEIRLEKRNVERTWYTQSHLLRAKSKSVRKQIYNELIDDPEVIIGTGKAIVDSLFNGIAFLGTCQEYLVDVRVLEGFDSKEQFYKSVALYGETFALKTLNKAFKVFHNIMENNCGKHRKARDQIVLDYMSPETLIFSGNRDYLSSGTKTESINRPNHIGFGLCCCPIPGSNIIGHLYPNKEKIAILHKDDCYALNSPRFRELEKDSYQFEGSSEHYFDVGVEVFAIDRIGLQRELTEVIRKHNVNIDATLVYSVKTEMAALSILHYGFKMDGQFTVNNLIKDMQTIPYVIEVFTGAHPYFIAKLLRYYPMINIHSLSATV